MKKELSTGMSLVPIIALIGAAALSIFIWKAGMHVPLMIGVITAAIVSIIAGWSWDEVQQMMVKGVERALPAVFILLIIGIIVGTWIASGVIPTIIYYGLSIIKPAMFVPIVALVTGIISITLGSSFTSIATIGLAFMAIGQGLGFSPGLVAGAVISGAYFGDKLSPLSDTTNIAPAMAETDLFSHVKHMLWDTIPAFVISIVLYWLVSQSASANRGADTNVIDAMKTGLDNVFVIHPLLLLMPVLTIILMIKRTPAIPALMGVSILGGLLAIFVQGATADFCYSNHDKWISRGVRRKSIRYLVKSRGTHVHAGDHWVVNPRNSTRGNIRGDWVIRCFNQKNNVKSPFDWCLNQHHHSFNLYCGICQWGTIFSHYFTSKNICKRLQKDGD